VDKENFFSSLNPRGSEFEDSIIASKISREFHETKFTEVYFHVYSVGGNPAFKNQRKKTFNGTDGIIFVFDANKTHWDDNVSSLKELKKLTGDSLIRKIPLIIMLNKCDLPDRTELPAVKALLKKEKLFYESPHELFIWNPAIFETISLEKNQKGVYEAFEEILRRTGIYLKFGKIPIPRGEETTRINLTLPKSLKAEWDEFAKITLKTSLSQMIRNAVREYRMRYGEIRENSRDNEKKDPIDLKIEALVSKKFNELLKKLESG
jgi:signal recognition particle receptor subunit beta